MSNITPSPTPDPLARAIELVWSLWFLCEPILLIALVVRAIADPASMPTLAWITILGIGTSSLTRARRSREPPG